MHPKFTITGQDGIIITLGHKLDIATNSLAISTEKTIRQNKPNYILESTPLLCSVFIRYDIQKIDFYSAVKDIKNILKKSPPQNIKTQNRLWHLPICYENPYAPDIEELARLMKLSPDDIIKAHAKETLQVLMLGFAPGWIYGGLLPPIWNIPRLNAAKPNVPAGSVSVAVRQMVISTTLSPTGWRTIGRTPYLNYDITRPHDDIFTLQAGDLIKIEQISEKEFHSLQKDFAAHRKSLEYQELD